MLFIKWSTTVVLLLSLVGVSEALTFAEQNWPSCDVNRLKNPFNDCLNTMDKNVKKLRFSEGHFVKVRTFKIQLTSTSKPDNIFIYLPFSHSLSHLS